MNGSTVCAAHGGLAPAVREAARRREAQRRSAAVVARLDVEPLQDPIQALLRTAAELIALKDWTAQAFAQATADEQWMLAELLGRNLERCSKLLVQLNALGLEERRVRVEEELAQQLAQAMRATVTRLGHDPWAPEVRAAVRHGFMVIDGDVEAST